MNATEWDFRTLSRIVAMLIALAVLAERAGGRSFPVRWLVLCILRRAEAVAHAFVVEATQANWPCLEEDFGSESAPLEAVWLAWRLRVLAAVLGAFLRLAGRCDGWTASIGFAPRRLAPPLVFMIVFGGWTLRAYDTS